MPVFCPFTTKTLEETVRGELICFPSDRGEHDWGLMLDVGDMGRRQFAVLTSHQPDRPAFMIYQEDEGTECVSFGREWVFEPLPLLGVISRDLREETGCWIVQGEEVAMRFALRPRGEVVFSLLTFETANVGRFFAVGGRYWRLWAS